jgi:hypothetical protein
MNSCIKNVCVWIVITGLIVVLWTVNDQGQLDTLGNWDSSSSNRISA